MDIKQDVNFLVVDDQDLMLQAIRDILHCQGYNHVLLAKSGRDAFAILKKCTVKFVVTDWNMPHMDGIDLLRLMRRNPDFSEIPVLMVSDEESKEKFFYALEEGADGYQLKPFIEIELVAALTTIIKKRNSQNPLQKELAAIRRLKLLEKYHEAIARGKALRATTDHPDLTYLMAECHVQLKQFKKAGVLLKKLLSESPNGKALHLYGRIKKAEKKNDVALGYLRKANALNPLNLERGIDILESCLEIGDQEAAAAASESVLRRKPSDINLVAMGKIYLRHGMLKEASQVLNKTAEPIPEVIGTFNDFAMALRKKGRFKESIEQYLKCLKVMPDQPLLLGNLSHAYIDAGQTDKAVETLEHLVRIHPNFAKGRKFLAQALKRQEQEKAVGVTGHMGDRQSELVDYRPLESTG